MQCIYYPDISRKETSLDTMEYTAVCLRAAYQTILPGGDVADVIAILNVARLGRKLRGPLGDGRGGACRPGGDSGTC
jgi:hypothetical protein